MATTWKHFHEKDLIYYIPFIIHTTPDPLYSAFFVIFIIFRILYFENSFTVYERQFCVSYGIGTLYLPLSMSVKILIPLSRETGIRSSDLCLRTIGRSLKYLWSASVCPHRVRNVVQSDLVNFILCLTLKAYNIKEVMILTSWTSKYGITIFHPVLPWMDKYVHATSLVQPTHHGSALSYNRCNRLWQKSRTLFSRCSTHVNHAQPIAMNLSSWEDVFHLVLGQKNWTRTIKWWIS